MDIVEDIDSDDDYRSKDLDFFKDSLIGRPDLRRKQRMIKLFIDFIRSTKKEEDTILIE